MGFNLMAFFAKGDESIIEDAKKKWPEAQGKVIDTPFKGIGVAGPYLNESKSDEEHEKGLEIAYDMEENLPEWSKAYPETVFVFVEADCTGGTCIYEGYACKNGKIIAKEQSKDALKPLMKHLGIELGDGQHFKPFERGFFK